MVIVNKLIKTVFVATVFSGGISSAALSQEQAQATGNPRVITESFDGDDSSLLLGGQIDLGSDSAPWLIYLADGKLVMENRTNPQSLHYDDISWVRFPGSEVLVPTDNLVISAVVDGKSEGRGGAGILVGSGTAGAYLMFSVDGQGRYHLFQKNGRKLRAVHSAKHPAINIGTPNRVSFQARGAHVAFLVNETEVLQFPYSAKMTNSRQMNGKSGIGLSAFGIGSFYFDDIEITPAN